MEHEEAVGDAAAGATDGEDGKLTAVNDGMAMGDEEELLAVCCDVCKLEDGVMWAMVVHRSSDRGRGRSGGGGGNTSTTTNLL
jgi:hypothetical protein